jgi:hypothetical protein
MTVFKGLLEASAMLVVTAVIAAISALSWMMINGGEFAGRMGSCLVLLGVGLAITGNSGFSRMGSSQAFAWFGLGPEVGSVHAGGTRLLTGIGLFVLVSAPLMAIGAMLSG